MKRSIQLFRKLIRAMVALFLSMVVYNAFAQKNVADRQQIYLKFDNRVDAEKMQLGHTYRNSFGEPFTIRTFKYYISNISLNEKDGNSVRVKGCHLINEADSSSTVIAVSGTRQDYTDISFTIGVDSIYNVSGVQNGDLDPMKGMFWTWNSGYILAKLEATSPLSEAPNNNVTYHIGGYKNGENASRKIRLSIQSGSLNVGSSMHQIVINVNANKWFNGVHDLTIKNNSVCTTPGRLAMQYADNFSTMFTAATLQ